MSARRILETEPILMGRRGGCSDGCHAGPVDFSIFGSSGTTWETRNISKRDRAGGSLRRPARLRRG